MKARMLGTITGCYHGVQFDIPKGTICEVDEIKGNVVYVAWEDEIATVYKWYVEII